MLASRVLFGVAIVLVGGAIASLFLPSRPTAEPPLIVGPLTLDLGTVPAGPRTVTFTVANLADRPRRVIGLAEG